MEVPCFHFRARQDEALLGTLALPACFPPPGILVLPSRVPQVSHRVSSRLVLQKEIHRRQLPTGSGTPLVVLSALGGACLLGSFGLSRS